MISNKLKWIFYKRLRLMKSISGFTAKWNSSLCPDSIVSEYSRLFGGAKLYKSSIGRFTHIHNSSLALTDVGAFSSIASDSIIGGGGEHPLNQVSTHAVFYSENNYINKEIAFTSSQLFSDSIKPVSIGNDVWVGSNTIIKQGVTIGNGAVIATGSVVVKDVPPYAIVGGVPAKVIRYRHNDELIELLQKSNWWDWPVEKLQVISDMFDEAESLTVEKFQQIIDKANAIS